MPHQFPFDHILKDQAACMTAFDIRLTLKLIPDVDVFFDAGFKEDSVEGLEFLEIAFSVMEEVVIPSPRQV